ncbi:MAG: permease [Erysipelotrichales bacterium]|nr:permease [Erysipelotrichales bacterium]
MQVINQIGDFINNQLLKMLWLSSLIEKFISFLFGQDFLESRWGSMIVFFIYDFIKIGILLCFLIFIISYIQSYFPPERTKKILSKYKGIGANILGALLGTLTPFCACSSIPIFIGFTRAGLSSGVMFSFLISSPLVDLGALVILTSIFGFKIALLYVILGLILAVVGGTIIEKSGLGDNIEPFVLGEQNIDIEEVKISQKERLVYAGQQMLQTYRKVVLYIVIGVGIGALIHNVIPEEWVQSVLGVNNPFSVLIATVIGTPMYADIFGTIPIAEALYTKGVGLGTILSFMMSVTALSIPSLLMLKKVVKTKLLFGFIVVVVVGIIVIGYVFNALQFLFV